MQPSEPTPLHPAAYDFIVNPNQPGKQSPLKVGSPAIRLAIVAGGLLLLLILFVVIRGLLTSSSNNYPALLTVAQEQQELLHITSAATQTGANDNLKNNLLTTQLSIGSDQSALLKYLGAGHHKVEKKVLNLKVTKSVDAQLAAAAAASKYDPTLRQVLKSQLAAYRESLKLAYAKTSGHNGKVLLSKQYDHAGLLLKQLDTASL